PYVVQTRDTLLGNYRCVLKMIIYSMPLETSLLATLDSTGSSNAPMRRTRVMSTMP
ncbi:hypothetical protein L9F63_022225, partial [Diploptera punctata]